jgi:hypothetical protein
MLRGDVSAAAYSGFASKFRLIGIVVAPETFVTCGDDQGTGPADESDQSAPRQLSITLDAGAGGAGGRIG